MNSRVYNVRKSCVVPLCENKSKKHPDKLFIYVPNDKIVRNKWLNLARFDPTVLSVNTSIYFCEDHFDLPNDMENYIQYRVMGSVSQIRMKPGCVPTKFECQPDRRKRTSNTTERPYIIKKQRKELIEESVRDLGERNNPSIHFELETSTGNPDSGSREQDPLRRVTEQCRFCGEFSEDCIAVSSDMTYLAGNKTTLALNNTSVQLDFYDRSLPNTVCRYCDAKLQAFCDFVNVVKAAQGTLTNVAEEKDDIETRSEFEEKSEYEETETLIVKTEYDSQQEDRDDDKEGILDSSTFSETVFVEETHKWNRDTSKSKKLKAKEKCDDDLVIAIKEEVVEKDTNEQSEVGDTETDVKPSELELERSALLFKNVNIRNTKQDAQPVPGGLWDTRTPLDSGGREHDPLSQVVKQCRFCGDFFKDCVAVSSGMTYLAGNKTTLALNDTSVQLDFNDHSLPKTVCRRCEAKLHEFCEFIKVVKAAQCTLINVAEEFEEPTEDFVESTAEYEEIETLVVKTEDSDDNMEGIVDPLAVGETVFVNKTHKRKSDTDTAKHKELTAKEKYDDDLEVAAKDTNEQSGVSDTGTHVKPSELELARSDLVFQMAGYGTSEYQGRRSYKYIER